MSKGLGTTIALILLCGILGGYMGELLALLIPTGFFHDFFLKGFGLGFDNPLVLNLRIITVSFGIKLFVNLCGLLGMIAGLFYSR